MGGGDLNLKKSWHPALFKNQERVWLEEKRALEERKRTEQMRKEIAEERERKELERMHAERTGKKIVDRVEWMYAAPGSNGDANAGEEMESYLLGKRRLDKLLADEDEIKPPMSNGDLAGRERDEQESQSKVSANARDLANKVRDDPLLQIKKQQQAAMQTSARSKEERKRKKHEERRRDRDRKHGHRLHSRYHRDDRYHDQRHDRDERHDDYDQRHHRRPRSSSYSRSPSPRRHHLHHRHRHD